MPEIDALQAAVSVELMVVLVENRTEISKAPELEAVHAQLELKKQAAGAGPVGELTARVEADPADLQARFDLAQALYANGKVQEAVDQLTWDPTHPDLLGAVKVS